MGVVKGVPITRYCDEHRLNPRERLELFVPICQAVQHAHQKGIIHRDLKPTNVMVCLYDDKPVPKVIDFGLAKAAGVKLTERTLFTEFGSIVGTLEYMSPEQAQLNQLDIDTRSDIYSLGVLLYELLTGTTPLRRERFRDTAVLEVLRQIREDEPPRPSVRLSTIQALPRSPRNAAWSRAKLQRPGPRRAGLDRNEGPGEGPQPAVRDGQRAGSRYRAVPEQRGGSSLSAVGLVSSLQIRTAAIGGPCWRPVCCSWLCWGASWARPWDCCKRRPPRGPSGWRSWTPGPSKISRRKQSRRKRRGLRLRGAWPMK